MGTTQNVNLSLTMNRLRKNAQNVTTLWQNVNFVKKRSMNALNASTKLTPKSFSNKTLRTYGASLLANPSLQEVKTLHVRNLHL